MMRRHHTPQQMTSAEYRKMLKYTIAEAAARADTIAEVHLLSTDLPRNDLLRLVTGVATNSTENPCAFVSFTPLFGSARGWALDLMRRSASAPPGMIELLLVRAIEHFRSRGAIVVNLGMVATADTKQEMSTSQRQIASFLSDHLRLLETHRSLFAFKQKFHPSWESRYVVTSSTLALVKTALAILRVHSSK